MRRSGTGLDRSRHTRLGLALRRYEGRVIGGYRIRSAGRERTTLVYRLQPAAT